MGNFPLSTEKWDITHFVVESFSGAAMMGREGFMKIDASVGSAKDESYTQEYLRLGKPNEGCTVNAISEAVRLMKADHRDSSEKPEAVSG